jgi:hypothetical protein
VGNFSHESFSSGFLPRFSVWWVFYRYGFLSGGSLTAGFYLKTQEAAF